MILINLAISSVTLGIAFCAPPGIVTAETIRRGMVKGYWSALLIQLGSLIGDATWAILALSGGAFLVQNIPARLVLGILGIVLLLRLSWSALRGAWKGVQPKPIYTTNRNDFMTGVVLSLSNPFAVVFWLSVGSSTVFSLIPEPQFVHFSIFFFSFMAGALGYSFLLACLVSRGRRMVGPGLFRWVNGICALFLAGFAGQLTWNILQSLLEWV